MVDLSAMPHLTLFRAPSVPTFDPAHRRRIAVTPMPRLAAALFALAATSAAALAPPAPRPTLPAFESEAALRAWFEKWQEKLKEQQPVARSKDAVGSLMQGTPPPVASAA